MIPFDQDNMILKLDHTTRSNFITCPRKFYLRTIRGLQPEIGSTALLYGQTFHSCMEGYYSAIKAHGWDAKDKAIESGLILGGKTWNDERGRRQYIDDYRTFENLAGSFVDYINRMEADCHFLEVVATEHIFNIPITPQNQTEQILLEALPYDIIFNGRIDLKVKLNGMLWTNEFKTTGKAVTMMASRLNRSAQTIGYQFAAQQEDESVYGCLVVIHQITSRKGKDGNYGKVTTDFARIPQIYSKGDIASWRESFIYSCVQMYNCCRTNIYPMNHEGCYAYNTQCAYTRLCEQNRPLDEIITDGFVVERWDVENGYEASD